MAHPSLRIIIDDSKLISHIQISIPPHVAVYYQEYNIIDMDTMNEKMRDHKGKIILDLVSRKVNVC